MSKSKENRNNNWYWEWAAYKFTRTDVRNQAKEKKKKKNSIRKANKIKCRDAISKKILSFLIWCCCWCVFFFYYSLFSLFHVTRLSLLCMSFKVYNSLFRLALLSRKQKSTTSSTYTSANFIHIWIGCAQCYMRNIC